MLWGAETHLPAWPAGPEDSRAARAARSARDVVRRLSTVRVLMSDAQDDITPDGDAA